MLGHEFFQHEAVYIGAENVPTYIASQQQRLSVKKPFNPVIPDYTPKSERTKEVKLDFKPCCNCGKTITDGYYGRFADGGVCSKDCNIAQETKPKYPEHHPKE